MTMLNCMSQEAWGGGLGHGRSVKLFEVSFCLTSRGKASPRYFRDSGWKTADPDLTPSYSLPLNLSGHFLTREMVKTIAPEVGWS